MKKLYSPRVSVIIVHYQVKDLLFACLVSLQKTMGVKYEIIVVDNDESPQIEKELQKKFPDIRYIKNPQNTGYGAGNNLGAANAKGEYVFFLNPDTIVFPNTLRSLYEFSIKKKHAGAIAPLLLGVDKKPYHQGEKILTPLRGIVALSFINKLFPNNPVSREYLDVKADYTKERVIDVVPGTALFIKKSLFTAEKGFDEKFVLYFEEFDLCKRLQEKGYSNYSIPKAKVIHYGEKSTITRPDSKEIFLRSRFYYFKKHYGLIWALVVYLVTSIGKNTIMAVGISLLGLALTLYQLYERASFIGDQGWFYLSARNFLVDGQFPLVGIPSSHPWLHQGAIWTYLLAVAMWLGKFHPLSGFLLSAGIGVITTLILYSVAQKMFGTPIALISSALFSLSPAVIQENHMAYHTVPIPLVSICYMYMVYRLAQGQLSFLPWAMVCLAIFYQLELFSVIFAPLVLFAILYAVQQKKITKREFTSKLWLNTGIALVLSFLPILIYDFQNGFPQTVGFAAWIGYSLLKALHIFPVTGEPAQLSELSIFLADSLRKIILYPTAILSVLLFFISLGVIGYQLKKQIRKRLMYVLLLIWVALPFLGIIITKTPSHAYLPCIYPAVCLVLAIAIRTIIRAKQLAWAFVTLLLLINSYAVMYQFPKDYQTKDFGLARRVEVAQEIVQQARGQQFNLTGAGEWSHFASFTMNYEYLIWWLGGKVVKETVPLQFIITETTEGIFISQPTEYARMLQ